MDTKLCRLKDFFASRCVLITGGTGFIGMALIEGLLTSSPDLRRIYVVVREKKGLKPVERISKLLSNEIFDHLSSEIKAKVVPILGDLTAENFGLEPTILAEIRETVTVVYHSAGLIKFNRSLQETILMNVLSTLRCIELAKSLAKLSAFIYTSSITANTNIQGKISEKVYKTKRSPKEMIMLALESPSTLDKVPEIKSDMIEGHVNSYTYSKQLAENLILEELSGFTAGIVRPALVYGFYEHRIPGWMGRSMTGQCGQIKGHIKGAVRSMYGDPNSIYYCIPCDHVINCMMALAAFLGTQEIPPKLPVVAHLCNNKTINPITMQDIVNILNEESWKNPCDTYILLPRIKIRNGLRKTIHFALCYIIALAIYIPEKLLKMAPGNMKCVSNI
uniref:Fatty acyl-CoA reductase n=1 Tax=Phlebotomus papatasi TaxID=29031 RepID=A0A1B0GQL1_PHLPP